MVNYTEWFRFPKIWLNLAKPNQGKRHGKIHAPVASYPSITDRPQRIFFRGTWSIHSCSRRIAHVALPETSFLHRPSTLASRETRVSDAPAMNHGFEDLILSSTWHTVWSWYKINRFGSPQKGCSHVQPLGLVPGNGNGLGVKWKHQKASVSE